MSSTGIPRRTAIKGIGAMGAAMGVAGASQTAEGETRESANVGTRRTARARDGREQIVRRVTETPLVDSHEHLVEERERLDAANPRMAANDWSVVMGHYLESDLAVAGMPDQDRARFYGPGLDPIEKWRLLAPWWPHVKHTGYGQASAIALRELYGVDDLTERSVPRVQEGYERLVKPGFYRTVLSDVARLDSCQVNCLSQPFMESELPDLLLQDISILGMHMGPNVDAYAPAVGIEVHGLDDWHRVIDAWFEKYGPVAVAAKTQAAYSRDVDFEDVPAEDAAPVMERVVRKEPVSAEERKRLEDHLFWYCTRKATEYNLPVKLHTGYYAGHNRMTLDVVGRNPESISRVLQRAVQTLPDARFVLMHVCYPYYEDVISLAKQYTNCTVDMCWAWIINPAASVQFLKHFIVTAPANKVLTFGGDFIPVEPVVGHAAIARNGIAQALTELVDEGWLTVDDAVALVEPLMCGNGRALFSLEEKKAACREVSWAVG